MILGGVVLRKRGGVGDVRINVYGSGGTIITSVLIDDTHLDRTTKEIDVVGTQIIEDELNKEPIKVSDGVPYYKIDSKYLYPMTAFSSTPIGHIDEVNKHITLSASQRCR